MRSRQRQHKQFRCDQGLSRRRLNAGQAKTSEIAKISTLHKSRRFVRIHRWRPVGLRTYSSGIRIYRVIKRYVHNHSRLCAASASEKKGECGKEYAEIHEGYGIRDSGGRQVPNAGVFSFFGIAPRRRVKGRAPRSRSRQTLDLLPKRSNPLGRLPCIMGPRPVSHPPRLVSGQSGDKHPERNVRVLVTGMGSDVRVNAGGGTVKQEKTEILLWQLSRFSLAAFSVSSVP
ncbi:hypothetical protein UC8_45540 [Roseimaritima ulvae]|uniref:Uncharacterized protein n=1 Tax=Roseimaritima ulvae TaxID=980254 RepID=A0A5B9QYP1_9BACT|nr:hypothetical protein UC8_45540 [Roseimaritima ulvae]